MFAGSFPVRAMAYDDGVVFPQRAAGAAVRVASRGVVMERHAKGHENQHRSLPSADSENAC